MPNYIEPFAGSLATLLSRPSAARVETVNDLDCWIANFWRALSADPAELASHADWPVNEADLHARHTWLVNQLEFRERMKVDPDYFDVKIAGWWVWGICQWIGSGWCERPEWTGRTAAGRAARGVCKSIRPSLAGSMGVHQKRPRLAAGERGASRQIPQLSGDGSGSGRGVLSRKLPRLGDHGVGQHSDTASNIGLVDWLQDLSSRLRRVRVCCGDWKRVTGPAVTTCIGLTGILLDPPYAVEDRKDVYGQESKTIAHEVREWAIANGNNPDLRIALCGYDGEHAMPDSWECIAWKANGGYANQANGATQGRKNAGRERIWFSPHCLRTANLFDFPADAA